MAPWQSTEVGFSAGVHFMFASLGFVCAVSVVAGAAVLVYRAMEKLKP